jgi:hypothetical protein
MGSLGRSKMAKESYTAEELAALFKEIREDEAAAKREDAHWYGMAAFEKFLDARKKAPAAEKAQDKETDKGIER